MKAKFSVLAACLAVACATVAQAGDRLYFTQDSGSNDTISKVNSLTRGVMGGGIGSEAGFAAGGTGTDNLGDIAAANINGTPVIATAGNVIHTWDADINFVNVTDVNGGAPDVPIREIAVGEMGGNADRLVIARETDLASTNIFVQIYEATTLTNLHNPGPHANIGNATGLTLGDFDSTLPGREIGIGTTDLATLNKSPGFQLYVRGDNGNWLGQQPLNQPISDVASGDLVPGVNSDEMILTGNIGGDPGPGFGQQSHVFSRTSGGGIAYQFENGGGGPHGPGGLLFNAVDVGQLDADPEPEIVLVGNDVVRVLNHDGSFVFQTGPTNQNFVDVVIADAMDDDGVNEIVAVSDSGLVFAYGHSVIGDASSAFSGGALGFFSGGAAYTAVTALNPVPEPTTALLMLLASVGAVGFRRR